jgi:hypothetical protein
MKIVRYEYIGSERGHIGMIAQEVEEYYPELIREDKDGYLSINYIEMIPLIIDYNKKLKEKIEKIEEQINKSKII